MTAGQLPSAGQEIISGAAAGDLTQGRGLGAPVPNLRTLHRDMMRLVYESAERDLFLASLVDLLRKLTNASIVVYFQCSPTSTLDAGPRSVASEYGPNADRDIVHLANWAEMACRQQCLVAHRLTTERVALTAPVRTPGGQVGALCAVLQLSTAGMEPFVIILELVAGHVALWYEHQRSRALDHEAANLAAIVELIAKSVQSDGLANAAQSVVSAARAYVDCEQVAIGLAASGSKACQLTAVSSSVTVDSRSELTGAFEAALTECLMRNAPASWPPDSQSDRHLLSAHEQLSSAIGGATLHSAPLNDMHGKAIGAWVFVGLRDAARDGRRQQFIRGCLEPVGACLDLAQRADRATRLTSWLNVFGNRRFLRTKTFWIAVGLMAATLALPLPYRIACKCQIEPVVRRYVAAPHDGMFEKSLVESGDVVRRDQVLGRLDGREVRWEMAGLAADEGRAAKSRDVNMAAGKTAAAQIDVMEMERLSHKRHLLEHRADHLDIKSPIDGMVISGDLQRSEGVPVTVGQALYEIAPLDQMMAEIAIPDEERSYVREGQSVTISLDAYPGMSWSGPLMRINPRSEERDDDNIFVGEVILKNVDGILRPGMKGRSKIGGPRYPVIWILLHTPWNAFLCWMGW